MTRLPLAVAGALPAAARTPRPRTLRTMTTLHAPVVRLSDLFDDAGANAERVLGPGPGAGGRIVVEAAQLGAIARQFGVDWRPASSADRAVLDRPGRPLRREDVLDAVRNALDRGRRVGRLRRRAGRLHAAAGAGRSRSAAGGVRPRLRRQQPAASAPCSRSPARRWNRSICASTGRVDDTVELPVATTRLLAGSVLRAERRAHGARAHVACCAARWCAGPAMRSACR